METIQVVLDKKLLQATNQAARRAQSNRSAFIREALRLYLRKLRLEAMEACDREGFRQLPADPAEVKHWAKAATWPDE